MTSPHREAGITYALRGRAMVERVREFVDRNAAVRARVARFRNPAPLEPAEKMLPEVLAELDVHHEELSVAEEELQAQIEELSRVGNALGRERAKYKELFDEAPDPYFVTDLHGLVLEANPRAAQLAGRDSSSLQRKPLAALVEQDHVHVVRESLLQLRPRDTFSIEVPFRGSAEPHWVELTAHVATNGERIRWLARDVSARRHALRAVTHDRDALEARVAERTVELQRALRDKEDLLAREQALRSELEIANAAKDRFLAILSHDLRGPLNAVLGWTALLRREHLDSRTRDKALATIERNALTQAELVEALLDVSRIGAGKLQLDMRIVDLGDLARKGLDALLPAAREKGVELVDRTAHASALVVGDAARLRQVIANLLGNALAFTPGGGRIEIDLSVTADVELRIRDTGRGISEAALAFVFDCFRQNERVTPATRGLGLGLYIVRRLVEMHGGTVTAKSEGEDRGSVLTVALPRRAIEGQLPPAAESSAALPGTTEERALTLAGLRVLLVDDEADTRELLGTALTREGAILLTAADGRTALEMFGKLVPDVVVSDIGLPDMTGRALIRRIRRSGIGADVCAIAVSGFASQDDARRSLKAGFDAHVAKPFRVHELVGAITTARARRSDG